MKLHGSLKETCLKQITKLHAMLEGEMVYENAKAKEK